MENKNIEEIYELSSMQQGMLFHTVYEPESEVYFEQLLCTIKGTLKGAVLEQAWQQVVARHPVLRSSFYWEEVDDPLQVVHKQVELPWTYHHWQDLTAQEQQYRLEGLLDSDRRLGFDLEQAPLMRLNLIQLGDQTYQLLWSHHHILFDGWSMAIVLQEAFAFYEATIKGEALHLKSPRPYRDYISWLKQQDLEQAKTFWQQKLQGFESPTVIRVNQGKQQTKGHQEQRFSLSPENTNQLQSLVRQHHLTLNTVVQGAWAILLSRYSGESDIIFGATVSGRSTTLPGVESMVGVLINTLATRVKVARETELLPWLKELQAQQIEQEQYAYYPLAEIQTLSDVPQGTPLFESILVFENYPMKESQQKGSLDVGEFRGFGHTNYPLTVVAVPGVELSIKVLYDTDRFSANTLNRLMEHFHTLLVEIGQNPQRQLDQVSILTAEERHKLLVEWNKTEKDYPWDRCIHHLFEEQVNKAPNAVAVVYKGQQLTYLELNHEANQLAHYLQSLGVKPGELVGICVEKSVEAIIGILAILKAGGAYVPLDPTYPKEHLDYLFNDSDFSVLLTQQTSVQNLPDHKAQIICLDRERDLIRTHGQDNLTPSIDANHLAYVIYTSGSTGKPKGVLVTHQGLCNLAHGQKDFLEIQPHSRVLQFASLSFDASVFEIFVTLVAGATLVLEDSTSLLPGADLVQTLNRYKITHVTLPPSALAVLPPDDLSALKTLIVAGEACTSQLVKQWGKGRRFLNAYGPTEGTVCATVAVVSGDEEKPSIGRPIPNVTTYILDSHLQPVPIGVAGEIYIGGVGLAQGYLNRPELTQEKFISNPFSPEIASPEIEERLYKTGDLAYYLPDGKIEFLGRVDHQLKIRGFRIEPGEIQTVLTQHPDVKEAVIMAYEKPPGNHSLVAYLVTQKSELDRTQVRNFCKQKLPLYKIPSGFVFLEKLPLTPNGKIDRRALPTPDLSQRHLGGNFVAPRTSTETELATIWREVLKIEQVSINDNFFELGGHSLLATQVISRVREAYSIELPVSCLFEYPTILELGEKVIEKQFEVSELDDLEQILNEVNELSDDEVDEQLLMNN
ncbi:amino acid adenylation domain-containing protein [Moorena sp. SIO3B2]|uniref:non-ribosomal peptide synthetase n=2 Tax=unclassified Moorena TaxID=2683338 RepID=UPI0013CBE3A4|nr:amino acid adenylation domain-containing protein [Moorena sp. SIO3B2]NEP32738.1 amino acid adenylation domain-containing protein [Moorena sp. SIO3B2]